MSSLLSDLYFRFPPCQRSAKRQKDKIPIYTPIIGKNQYIGKLMECGLVKYIFN